MDTTPNITAANILTRFARVGAGAKIHADISEEGHFYVRCGIGNNGRKIGARTIIDGAYALGHTDRLCPKCFPNGITR